MHETLKNYKWAVIAGVITFALYALLCGLSDNGGGVDDARSELNRAIENQQQLADGIDRVEGRVEAITDGIDGSAEGMRSAQNRLDRIEEDIGRAEGLITECQRIIGGIRERGEAD